RNQFMVDEKASVDVRIRCAEAVVADFNQLREFIISLAKVGYFEAGPDIAKPPGSITWTHSDFELYVDLRTVVDLDAVVQLLMKQKVQKQTQLQNAQAKLNNSNFVAKAAPEVVQQQRDLLMDLQEQLSVLENSLQELKK